ncbi:hypothetical protein Syun_003956 [Stephania yunnanensis]|uniref:Uncharacterized protein n=1 Tax=Stephania yunnanensis TaxID=152371 RepID=A0AAP0L597_9MAGN
MDDASMMRLTRRKVSHHEEDEDEIREVFLDDENIIHEVDVDEEDLPNAEEDAGMDPDMVESRDRVLVEEAATAVGITVEAMVRMSLKAVVVGAAILLCSYSFALFNLRHSELYSNACALFRSKIGSNQRGSDDKGFLWRIGQGDWAQDLQGHKVSISCLNFSATGQLLAYVSLDGLV